MPERRKSRRMISRDGREEKEGKMTGVSTKEKNNCHIHHNTPYLLNPGKNSLLYEHPMPYMNCKAIKMRVSEVMIL